MSSMQFSFDEAESPFISTPDRQKYERSPGYGFTKKSYYFLAALLQMALIIMYTLTAVYFVRSKQSQCLESLNGMLQEELSKLKTDFVF